MYIKSLYLNNFRNYESVKVDFKNGINIIVGENGQGKTNLLEGIYVLGITKSHRSFIDNNLVKNGTKKAMIQGILQNDTLDTKYEIELSNQKILKIDNDVIKSITSYVSNINVIIFYPDDLEIIKGSPNLRRRYINIELSQLQSGYMILLNEYNKILKMRNDYLKQPIIDDSYLKILTDYLIEKATLITKMRNKFINYLNEYVSSIYENISSIPNFNLQYKTNLNFSDFKEETIKEQYRLKFESNLELEKRLKTTCFGPQKDDLEFFIGDYNLKTFGSQGQQRMAILSLKLSEIEIFKKYKNTIPILLLDDVFSELDDKKKNNLLHYINENIQTIITTTDINNIDKNIVDTAKIIEIENATIKTEVK